MSVRAMAWVWEHSRARPIPRLVLLAIADCANDTGGDAYPSGRTLAAKTGLTERGVQKSVAELVRIGELEVRHKAGPRGCNRYRVLMGDGEHGSGYPERGSLSTQDHPEQGSVRTTNVVPDTTNDVRVPSRTTFTQTISTHQEPSLEPSRRRKPDPADRPDVEKVCQRLADAITANGSKRPTITKAWRDAARLLIDKDGRTVDQIIRCIDWCQNDTFWRANVLSMPKLREKYDQLRLAAQRDRRHRPYTNPEDPSAYTGEL